MPNPAEESVFGPSAARLYAWPIENMLNLQATLFSALQSSAKGWIERRQQATNATVEAFEKLLNCRTVEQAVSIQQEWLEGSLRRLDADWRAFAEQAGTMTRETVAKADEAGSRAAEASVAATRSVERVGRAVARAGQETAESVKRTAQESQNALAAATQPNKS